MRVIGTAGHVDHGKSTLIAALTGTHPDRLKEEQERQMTIDLGFAWMTLPDGQEVGIVDVPGHRDFIENMLSGVGGIDAALLVIAADEGVMPQTREHLAILDLLQIQNGLVVLTKTDLIDDPAWLELVEADIRAVLRGTVLQDAPILRVSARSGSGLPELLVALGQLLQKTNPRLDLGRPRLPIDRVFTMTGFGTVVTGTLTDGHLSVGDEVEILPSGLKGRVRGLQTHKKKEETAVPGSRTAINLAGMETAQVQRGEVVARPGQYQPSQRLDVQFKLLQDVQAPLHHHGEVKLFLNTSETMAEVRLLGVEKMDPGSAGWLQLELRQPLVAVRGDRYILRRPSPAETLGGGVVVDPFPRERHKRFDQAVVGRLESLLKGTPADVLFQASLALGPATVKEVVARSRLEPGEASAALEASITSGSIVSLDDGAVTIAGDGLLVALPQWEALKESAKTAIANYHRSYPLRRGIPREELKSRLKCSPRVFSALLRKLAAQGEVVDDARWVSLSGYQVSFSPLQQGSVDRLVEKFEASPYSPPSVKECQAEVGEAVFSALLENGDFVAVSEEVVFRKSDYEKMVGEIRRVLEHKGQITLAEVRDLFQTSRRYVQALLEHLDAIGMTVRQGESRRLKK
jgi:selenocysteine-specific elongation factor